MNKVRSQANSLTECASHDVAFNNCEDLKIAHLNVQLHDVHFGIDQLS